MSSLERTIRTCTAMVVQTAVVVPALAMDLGLVARTLLVVWAGAAGFLLMRKAVARA